MAKQTFTTGQVLTAAQMTSLQQTAMGGGSTTAKTTSYVLVAADAGTVVQMNAAGATTITINTALFAAGDTVQIQNIGAGVCTVTAGTATVTTAGSLALSQWEGGQLYFTATSSAIFFDIVQAATSIPLTTKGDLFGYDTANARVPIGTNNQVLTADSAQALGLKWATPASGKIIQVVTGKTSTITTIATTTMTDTTITATITPTLNTSTILVLISAQYDASRTNTSIAVGAKLYRGATLIADYSTVGFSLINIGGATSVGIRGTYAINTSDSPASTSALTYKLQAAPSSTTNSGQCVFQSDGPSMITLIEVGA